MKKILNEIQLKEVKLGEVLEGVLEEVQLGEVLEDVLGERLEEAPKEVDL